MPGRVAVVGRAPIPDARPHVQAPEVMQGRPYDGRADLWSVGVLLYMSLHFGIWVFMTVGVCVLFLLHSLACCLYYTPFIT